MSGSQIGILESYITLRFEHFRQHAYQSVETQLDVVLAWLIMRLQADDPYFGVLKKMLVIRTHPEELHVVKWTPNT